MYRSTFGHVGTSCQSRRLSITCSRYTVGKTSDKNLEQQVKMRFCVRIGKSETLSLLTLTYGEFAIKNSSVFELHKRFKEGRTDVQDNPGSGQPKSRRTGDNSL
jgi:hypothetical protein